jgi:DNA-binding NtrC family response regulator
MSNYDVLFVDDEPNALEAFERQLRKRFSIRTAESAREALKILEKYGPCAVIVSDMRMPGMDGIQLLSRVKDLYPDTVRIMLTGNADQETAIGSVICILTPCGSCSPATPIRKQPSDR